MEVVQLGDFNIDLKSDPRFQVYTLLDKAKKEKNVCLKIIYVALYILASIVSAGIFAGVDSLMVSRAKKAIAPVVRAFVEYQKAFNADLRINMKKLSDKMGVLDKAAESNGEKQQAFGEKQQALSNVIDGLREKERVNEASAAELKRTIEAQEALMESSGKMLKKSISRANRKARELKVAQSELKELRAPGLAVRLTSLIEEALQLAPEDIHGLVGALEKQKSKRDVRELGKKRSKRNVKAKGRVLDGASGGIGGLTVKGDDRKARTDSIKQAFVSALRRASQSQVDTGISVD